MVGRQNGKAFELVRPIRGCRNNKVYIGPFLAIFGDLRKIKLVRGMKWENNGNGEMRIPIWPFLYWPRFQGNK